MAAVNRVGGLAAGIANAIFVKFYQYVVDPAEADTWPFRLFAYLAKGILRSACLQITLASVGMYFLQCFFCSSDASPQVMSALLPNDAALMYNVAGAEKTCWNSLPPPGTSPGV